MIVYALFLVIPDEYAYDGASEELNSIHMTREGAEAFGEKRVANYVRGSGVSFIIEEYEVKA